VVAVTEDSYKRHIVHLTLRTTSMVSETKCTTRLYKQKRTKAVSDNEHSFFTLSLNGDCLSWNAGNSYGQKALNIQYGNGASVVVRER